MGERQNAADFNGPVDSDQSQPPTAPRRYKIRKSRKKIPANGRAAVILSDNSRELLIDLVCNKLDSFEIYDRDDRRIMKTLECCLEELSGEASD
jgi:5-methylcytosine-specific restriction endonuclease McrA